MGYMILERMKYVFVYTFRVGLHDIDQQYYKKRKLCNFTAKLTAKLKPSMPSMVDQTVH